MLNKSVAVAHNVNGISLPEVASRQDWKNLSKSLFELQASSGLFGAENKDSDFNAIVAASYALLIRSTLDGDDSILKNAMLMVSRIPAALDKKGILKGRYALKIDALKCADNAAVAQRKKLAKSEVIKSVDLFNSEVLHAALVALQPVVKVAPTIKAVKIATVIPAVAPDEKPVRSLAFGHEYHEDMIRSSDASRIQAEFNLESEKQAARLAMEKMAAIEVDHVASLKAIAVNNPQIALSRLKEMAEMMGYKLVKLPARKAA